jgi:hypothetical protein
MKMRRQTTARAVGALFITATAAGVLSLPLLGIQNDPDSLVSASANRSEIVLGVVMVVAMIVAIIMIPAVLFPALKRHNEALALGYLAARIVEAVALLPAAVNPLLLLVLSSEYTGAGSPDTTHFETLRTLILAYDDVGAPISATVFCVGALILNYLLYRSNLVPRAISVWGLAGAALYLVGGVFVMFDLAIPSSVLEVVLPAPIALNEMALAIWLIIKGFNQSPAMAPGVAEADMRKIRPGSWEQGVPGQGKPAST